MLVWIVVLKVQVRENTRTLKLDLLKTNEMKTALKVKSSQLTV
jgi:hypothetical protein